MNGARIANLNLDGATHAGGVGVFTGYYAGSEWENGSTIFSGFKGSSMDRVPLSWPTDVPLDIEGKQAETFTEFEIRSLE